MYKNIFIKKQNFKTKSNNSSSNFRNVKTQRLVKIESVDDVYPEQDSGYFYAYDIFKKDKVKVSVNPATVQEMKAKGKVKSEKSEYSQWLIDEDFKNKVKKTIKTEQEDCYFLLMVKTKSLMVKPLKIFQWVGWLQNLRKKLH